MDGIQDVFHPRIINEVSGWPGASRLWPRRRRSRREPTPIRPGLCRRPSSSPSHLGAGDGGAGVWKALQSAEFLQTKAR